ncbi:ATP-grasp domain-containing protein [Kitasatospora sp. NPDC059571]|uniref:ATP-grasp domain-containing protein n=1 Tax=Kitasatospora sp. NPDC059571 TaxID=3346871 RepID=UPI0036799874
MSENDVVIVVGSGLRRYREYLLAGAARRHPVWLLDAAAPDWQLPYVTGADTVPLLDRARLVPDAEGLLATAARIAAERPVAGVFTYDETLVMATARIAEQLGLPGLSVDGADACRNKHRTRTALTAAGLPQPAFGYATTEAEARAHADRIGYPLVLKPRGMGASIGVVRADREAELSAAFTVAERAGHGGAPAYEGGVLLEEFVHGPEISVDGATRHGEYRPFFVAHKSLGSEPYFEEAGHVVCADDPLLRDPHLLDVLTRAHRALGLRDGITHTEVKLTDRGPVVIEVNARLGGDLIPYLGKLATGIDPAAVAADLATGTPPDLEPATTATTGIRFRYPKQDCTVARIHLPAPGELPGLVAAEAMAEPGARLLLPPNGYLSRYAYVICTADSPEECRARLDEAERAVLLEAQPLEP